MFTECFIIPRGNQLGKGKSKIEKIVGLSQQSLSPLSRDNYHRPEGAQLKLAQVLPEMVSGAHTYSPYSEMARYYT